MARRRAHGTAAKGGALVVHEPLPFDELRRPAPSAAPSGPVARRSNGTVADSAAARELGRRGGKASQLYSRILRSLGLVELAAGHAFRPYEAAGQDFADTYIASLARMFDGVCGEGPASIVKTAGLQLAVSRYFYDLGKQSGDVKLLGQASQLGNDSRVSAGSAYELQSREAEARAKANPPRERAQASLRRLPEGRLPMNRDVPTLEELFTHPDFWGVTTAAPVQRAACRIIDGLPLGDLACDPDVRWMVGGEAALAMLAPGGTAPKQVSLYGAVRIGKSDLASCLAFRASQTIDTTLPRPHEVIRIPVLSLTMGSRTRRPRSPTRSLAQGRAAAAPRPRGRRLRGGPSPERARGGDQGRRRGSRGRIADRQVERGSHLRREAPHARVGRRRRRELRRRARGGRRAPASRRAGHRPRLTVGSMGSRIRGHRQAMGQADASPRRASHDRADGQPHVVDGGAARGPQGKEPARLLDRRDGEFSESDTTVFRTEWVDAAEQLGAMIASAGTGRALDVGFMRSAPVAVLDVASGKKDTFAHGLLRWVRIDARHYRPRGTAVSTTRPRCLERRARATCPRFSRSRRSAASAVASIRRPAATQTSTASRSSGSAQACAPSSATSAKA